MGYQPGTWTGMFAIAPAGAYVGRWLQSFKGVPAAPEAGPDSTSIGVMEA